MLAWRRRIPRLLWLLVACLPLALGCASRSLGDTDRATILLIDAGGVRGADAQAAARTAVAAEIRTAPAIAHTRAAAGDFPGARVSGERDGRRLYLALCTLLC